MRRIFGALAGALAVLALAACTGGSAKESAGGVAIDRSGAAAAVAPAKPAPAGGPSTLPDPAVIRTADLTLHATDVAAAAGSAERLVAAHGGSVLDDQRGGSGNHARADLVVQVPSDTLASTLDKLRALGTQADLHTSTRDVTTQVADVNSRVLSMQAEIAQLRTFYGRAGSITELLDVESTLAQREADLESLQAQQRALRQQTSMATIDLHLLALPARSAAGDGHAPGFVTGIGHGWHAFTVAFSWLVAGLGVAVPFLAVGVLAGAGWFFARRRRHPSASR